MDAKAVSECLEGAEAALQSSSLGEAERLLRTARETVFAAHPELLSLFQKWSQRNKRDLKVTPGSQSIRLSLEDPRYALSAVCVLQSKVQLVKRLFAEGELSLREAYMWCPRSAQVLYLLAEVLRLTSHLVEHLSDLLGGRP